MTWDGHLGIVELLALTAARRVEVAAWTGLHWCVGARSVCVRAVRSADGSLVRERDRRAVGVCGLRMRRVALLVLLLLLHVGLVWVDLRPRLALLLQLRLLRLSLLRELMRRHRE